jgi:hypothetical protein
LDVNTSSEASNQLRERTTRVTANAQEQAVLFDGVSLSGWHATPRLPVPAAPGQPQPDTTTEDYVRAAASRGRWYVEDGAIVGGQEPPGSGYAVPAADFQRVWRWNDFNEFRIRCVGKYPVLTTWVNGVKLYELDTASMQHPNYDRDAVAEMLGREGHLALEVHDNDPKMGRDRWGETSVVRWRNFAITPVLAPETSTSR